MVVNRSKVLLILLGGCLAGVAGSFAYSCHLAPTKTTVRIIYAPSAPPSFSGSSVSVIRRPIHGLHVVPHMGFISPFSWSDLIEGNTTSLPVTTSFRDGVLIELEDLRWSWGAQRIEEANADLPSISPEGSLSVKIKVNDTGQSEFVGHISLCSTSSCSDVLARPNRLVCKDPDRELRLFIELTVKRGRANIVTIDTSPLPLLLPEKTNQPYLQGAAAPDCYSAFGDYENRVVASELPPAGGNLSYSIEEEMTGTPYPPPNVLKVSAKVIADEDRKRVPTDCADWTAGLAKTCWRAYEALPAGACSDAWLITLYTERRVLHFSRPRRLGLSCHLLLAVEAPEGNAVHAIAFKLEAPAPSPPIGTTPNERR